jgi:hypothetical protein
MANPLRKIEIELENLFEKTTGVLSTHTVHAGKMLARMIEALEERAQAGPGGRWIAPNRFHLTLGRRLMQTASIVPDLRTLLAAKLEEHIRQSEMVLLSPIRIEIAEDPALRPEGVRVRAEFDRPAEEATDGFRPIDPGAVALPPGAFLIINGRRHFPLNRPVVNIGRQLDNHLVLDDPLVSRRHAQLRARDGQYLLTDLGSKHGLRLNNAAVREAVLQPGDVVRLGNVELIYGDDREESITPPIPAENPPDRPGGSPAADTLARDGADE